MQKLVKRFMVLAFMLTVGATAQAHAPVKATSIADGAVLTVAPAAFTLGFSGKVGLAAITVEKDSGEVVALDYTPPKAMAGQFEIPLPALPAGGYTISWRTMSADGHIMPGKISFTLQ